MAANVPLTIRCLTTAPSQGYTSQIVFGTQQLALDAKYYNCYWAVVLDRSNLNVVENFSFKDNNTVPAQLQKYVSNPQYLLILTTQHLNTAYIPAGQLYTFLQQTGAGNALKEIEQIYQAMGCGTLMAMSYTLVTVLDTTQGFDYGEYHGDHFYTLQLIPIPNGSGGVLYTPSKF